MKPGRIVIEGIWEKNELKRTMEGQMSLVSIEEEETNSVYTNATLNNLVKQYKKAERDLFLNSGTTTFKKDGKISFENDTDSKNLIANSLKQIIDQFSFLSIRGSGGQTQQQASSQGPPISSSSSPLLLAEPESKRSAVPPRKKRKKYIFDTDNL